MGVGSVVVAFRVLGSSRFVVQRSQHPYLKVDLWKENRGAPKIAKSNHDALKEVSKGVPGASQPQWAPQSQKRVENRAKNLKETARENVDF